MNYFNEKTKLFNNQHSITIEKEEVKNVNGRQFLTVYADSLYGAMNTLTGAEFKVWLYLMNNKNGYVFGYSPEDVAQKTGISKDAAKKAKLSLIEKGYITEGDFGGYIFHDKPKTPNPFDEEEEKRTFFVGGKKQSFTFAELEKHLKEKNRPDTYIIDYWNHGIKEEN